MNRAMRASAVVAVALFVTISCLAQNATPPQTQAQPSVPVTQISADLGSCSVEFIVTNFAGKPIYDAKIKTQIRYGFLGKRKLDLEIGTNSNGLARFVKMPNEVKSPLVFEGRHGGDSMTLTWDPGTDCDAQYPMILGKKPDSTQQ
jgi:hypothetical protein